MELSLPLFLISVLFNQGTICKVLEAVVLNLSDLWASQSFCLTGFYPMIFTVLEIETVELGISLLFIKSS